MSLISVIVPNYNHAPYLRQRIDSIIHQTYQHFEIIILDDCSTDNSRQIIETYRGHNKVSHIIYNEKNTGSPFKQWQKGIKLAKGDWIWIAESDDVANPQFLEEAATMFRHFPSAGLFYCDGIIQDEESRKPPKLFSSIKNHIFKTQKWSSSYFQNGTAYLNEYLKLACTINNASGVVFQKKLLSDIPERLELFRYYGDWYFYIQLCLVTYICYSAKPLNIYRNHKKSLLNSATLALPSRKEYFLVLQLLYYSKEVTDKKYLLDHFCYHYISLGLFTHSLGNSWKIIKAWFEIDKRIAQKVIPRLIWMKVFRKRYKNKIRQIDYIENDHLS